MRRSRTLTLAFLVPLALVLSACASTTPAHTLPRVPLPSPSTITFGGQTYAVEAVSPAGALGTPTSQSLTIYVTRTPEPSSSSPSCNTLDSSSRIVSETATAIYVAAFAYNDPEAAKTACTELTTGSERIYVADKLTLDHPLGNRSIIDVHSGEPVGVLLSSEIRHPTYLPAGYTHVFDEGFSTALVATIQYQRGTSYLEIGARSITAWDQTGSKLPGQPSIDGHVGTVADSSYERCVSWSDPPGLLREVCSSGPSSQFLSPAELVKIARSLK